jgi:hypothetical protein
MAGYIIGPCGVAPAPTGLDAATTAWINAVVAAGGAVSTTQQGRVDTLIKALKAHSLFSMIDRLWLWAGESDTHQATIDIVNLGVLTVNNSPTFGASGYTGNTFNTSLDSGIQPSTFSGNYSLNSASFAFYETDNGTASNANTTGTNGTSPTTTISTFAFSTLWAYTINNGAFNNGTNTASTTQGMWGVGRTSSTATALYRNGSSTPVLSNGSDTSTSLPVSNLQWLAGGGQFNGGTFAMGAICGGMTGAQWAAFAADVNAYMTAWGVNVF